MFSTLHTLYVITNDDPWPLLWAKLQCILPLGYIRVLQYRRKHLTLQMQQQELAALVDVCGTHGVQLIVNDHVDLAAQWGLGVHLGQQDGSVLAARQQLGAQAVIGCTCHASSSLARQALQDGASYVAFGAVFASSTKPNAPVLPTALRAQLAQEFGQHACFIGGLTVENIHQCVHLPIGAFAVVGDIMDQPLDYIAARVHIWYAKLCELITFIYMMH